MKIQRILAVALATVGLTSGVASADFTASGTFLYRDRAQTYNGGFNGNEPALPIRQANVRVIDDSTGQTIVATVTDDNGFFSVVVPGSGTRDILVTCLSRSKQYGNNRIRVETTSQVLYSVSSSVFVGWDQSTDLDIGTVTSEKIFSGSSQANPFNMLDMCVSGLEYALAQGAPNPTGTIRMQWPGGGGSFASGFRANMATDDGYDDLVQLHELGHVLHNMYSESDNTGGSHFFGDSDQDPRLSYGEGWASFFGAAVRNWRGLNNPGIYLDCNGSGGTGSGTIQLRLQLETAAPYQSSTGGEATEVGVACVLYDIVDTASTPDGNGSDDDNLDGSFVFANAVDGDDAQWQSFTGPVALVPNLTIRDHWNALFNPVDYGAHAELEDLFQSRRIRNFNDVDEPNNSIATATPYTGNNAWTGIRTLYYSSATPPAPGDNDSDYYSFELTAGDDFDVETRYPNGDPDVETYADPFIRIRRPDGSIFATNNDGGTGRNAFFTSNFGAQAADATGTWTVQVTTTHPYRRTGSYELRIARTGASISGITPPAIEAFSATPQEIVINGFGFTNTTALTIDGIALTTGFNGDYQVDSDVAISVTVPPLTQTGPVDVVVTTATAIATTQLQVDEVSSPVVASPMTVLQPFGIELSSAAGVGDWTWVGASVFDTPTVIPGVFDLAIGDNGAQLSFPWKPVIGPQGYATKTFGPLSGLAGLTLYFQSFVLEAANNFDPPWPSSNVTSSFVFL